MACSNIRYGAGVTSEVGMDLVNMKAKHVGVFTDKNLAKLAPMKATVDSLTKAGVNFKVSRLITPLRYNRIHLILMSFLKFKNVETAMKKMNQA